MKKKTLVRSVLLAFLCCMMILGFQTSVKAETGNYYLKVNKGTNVVTVYTKDDKPYTAFVCSAGYATPLGTFHTMNKYSWWVLDGPSYGQYCTRITGSILFHSVWYYEQNKTTQSYVQYNKLGSLASHGCVRVTTAAAKWIYDNCPLQTTVIIFNGTSSDDPLGKPSSIKVNSAARMGWDPTDPDPNNTYNTKNTQPRISVKSRTATAQYNGTFRPVEMTAYDSAGNQLSNAWIRTSGAVNTKKMGSYPVTYSLTDSFGRDASVTVTYTVGDAKKAEISGVRNEVTKEYKSTIDLRSGVTAKNSMGTVLTDKIVVKIRKPGTSEYKGVKASSLKLRYTGTYRIMYYLKNPTNKLVTQKYMKVIVKDTKKPILSSTDKFARMKLAAGTSSVTYKKLISGVTAKLTSGKNMTSKISIKITDPKGKVKTVAKNGSYKFAGAGTYQVSYYCSNPSKSLATGKYLVAEKKRKLVVAEKAQKPEDPDDDQQDPDDGQDQQDPDDGQDQQNPDGTQQNPGSTQNPDGTQQNPGSTQNPDGTQQNPGSTQNPDGTQQNPGSTQNPDGTQQNPDSTAQNPGGTVQNPGSTQQNPGSTVQNPGGTAQNPGSTAQNPGGTVQNPGSTQQNPGGTAQNPGSTQQNPGGTAQNPQTPAAEPTVSSTVYALIVPADAVVPDGSVISLLQGVSLQIVSIMSDGTQRVTNSTEGISRKVTYQPSPAQQETEVMLTEGLEQIPVTTGIYRITYHYEDAQGNVAEKVRTVTVTAV